MRTKNWAQINIRRWRDYIKRLSHHPSTIREPFTFKGAIFITLIPSHRYWEGFVGYCVSCTCAYPLKTNCSTKIRLGCTMLSNRAYTLTQYDWNAMQCVNREVSQRSPRIQDIAALYLFHTKILRCKIVYVFSHSIIYHTVWYFSTYLLSYSNFNNEYAQSPITLHLWHRNYFNFRKTVLPLGRRGKASVQYMKSKCYMHDAIQIMNIRINNEMCQMTKIGYYWVVKFHTIRHRWLYNCREGYAASFLWYTTR